MYVIVILVVMVKCVAHNATSNDMITTYAQRERFPIQCTDGKMQAVGAPLQEVVRTTSDPSASCPIGSNGRHSEFYFPFFDPEHKPVIHSHHMEFSDGSLTFGTWVGISSLIVMILVLCVVGGYFVAYGTVPSVTDLRKAAIRYMPKRTTRPVDDEDL